MTITWFFATTCPQTETLRGCLARLGEFRGEAGLGFEELTVAIDERDQRDGHLEDARELRGDAVEDGLGLGVEQVQREERGEAFLLVCGDRRGRHLLGDRRRELGHLHERLCQRGDDFIGARIAQALGGFGEVFARAPKADHDFLPGQKRAQLQAKIAGVDDGGRRHDGDANDIHVRLFDQLEQLAGDQVGRMHSAHRNLAAAPTARAWRRRISSRVGARGQAIDAAVGRDRGSWAELSRFVLVALFDRRLDGTVGRVPRSSMMSRMLCSTLVELVRVQHFRAGIGLRGGEHRDENGIVQLGQGVRFQIGLHQFQFIGFARREQPMVAILGGSERFLIAQDDAEERKARDMPAHDHEADGERRREHEADRPPEPGPEHRRDDQRDGRNAGVRAVEPRLHHVVQQQLQHDKKRDGEERHRPAAARQPAREAWEGRGDPRPDVRNEAQHGAKRAPERSHSARR